MCFGKIYHKCTFPELCQNRFSFFSSTQSRIVVYRCTKYETNTTPEACSALFCNIYQLLFAVTQHNFCITTLKGSKLKCYNSTVFLQ